MDCESTHSVTMEIYVLGVATKLSNSSRVENRRNIVPKDWLAPVKADTLSPGLTHRSRSTRCAFSKSGSMRNSLKIPSRSLWSTLMA